MRIDLAWPEQASALDDEALTGLYAVGDRQSPWLRANFVSSLDGAATHNGLSGDLGSPADRRVFDILRRLCDVVLVGAGTVRAEGYGPMVLDDASTAWRVGHGLPAQPVFAIASGLLGLDPGSRTFTEAPVRPIVVTTSRSAPAHREALAEVADVIVCGDAAIDADAMLASFAERGLRQVHCEGGPTFFGSLLAADRVDELCLTLSPRLEAGDARRIARGELPEVRELELAHTLVAEDGTLLLRYVR